MPAAKADLGHPPGLIATTALKHYRNHIGARLKPPQPEARLDLIRVSLRSLRAFASRVLPSKLAFDRASFLHMATLFISDLDWSPREARSICRRHGLSLSERVVEAEWALLAGQVSVGGLLGLAERLLPDPTPVPLA